MSEFPEVISKFKLEEAKNDQNSKEILRLLASFLEIN